MKEVRRLLALVVASLLALPLYAQTPRSGGELVFPVPSEPPSYDGHREETFGLIHPIAPQVLITFLVLPKHLPSLAIQFTQTEA